MTLDDDSRSSDANSSERGATPPSEGHRAGSPPSLSELDGRGITPSSLSEQDGRGINSASLNEHEGRGIVGSDMLETAAANAGIVTVMAAVPVMGGATLLSPLSLGE